MSITEGQIYTGRFFIRTEFVVILEQRLDSGLGGAVRFGEWQWGHLRTE